jgi:hypothetical protein
MKIQFIIVGWHYSQIDNYYRGLKELNDNNDQIDVFWSCHREPINYIKDNFKYKVFFNGAEEVGAYEQAIEYLNLNNDTICFFLHDDLIIKDWGFINKCIELLNKGFKIIGNGKDYGYYFNPYEIVGSGPEKLGITEEFDGSCFKDYVKEKNKHLFNEARNIVKVRPSFIYMKYKSVEMGGFEPCKKAYVSPLVDKDKWCPTGGPHYRGHKGLSSFGNVFPALNCYKMNVVHGTHTITWLSNNYLDSKYLYEMGRGKIAKDHPIT